MLYISTISLDAFASMTLEEFSTLELTEPIVITNLGFASTAEVYSQSQHITQVFVPNIISTVYSNSLHITHVHVSNHIEHFIIDSQNKQEVYP